MAPAKPPVSRLTRLERMVLNNASQLLDSRVRLGSRLQEVIAAVNLSAASSAFTKTVHDAEDHTGLPGVPAAYVLDQSIPPALAFLLGDLAFKFDDNADGSEAGLVTAAAAGAKTKTIHVSLVDGSDVVQAWFNGRVTLSREVVCVDQDITIPGIGTGQDYVELEDGEGDFIIVYDTDGGDTKDYAAEDTVSVFIEEGYTPFIFGVRPDVTDATFTDTMIET